MASIYDAVDLDWSWDGDFIPGPDGDLLDTSDDHLRSLVTEIATVVKSSLQDWRDNPEIGSGIDDFIGEPNDRETARNLQIRLQASLLQIVKGQDLSVRIVPFHIHKVAIFIAVQALPTRANHLNSFQPVTMTFVFDYQENGLYVPSSSMNHFQEVRDDI